MADGSSKLNRTQIAVALIGVANAIAVALIANGDKLFHASPAKSAVSSTPTASAATATADVAGFWHDDDGYDYAFEQSGGSYSYRQLRKGHVEGGGAGHIVGRAMKHSFSTATGGGVCEATVSDDARMISGVCGEGANHWPFSLRRGSS